jgi:hypothetical protein
MLNAFSVGITVELIDKFSAGIGGLTRSLMSAQGAASGLHGKLAACQKSMLLGGAMIGAVAALAAPIIGATKAAEDYMHTINRMNSAGLSHKEVIESIGAAWKTTVKAPTSTATDNLKTILELRTILTHTKEAINFLPAFATFRGALPAVAEGKFKGQEEGLAYSAMKAVDMMGRVGSRAEILSQVGQMFRVMEATGAKVMPQDYMTTLKYARQAKFGLNDDFLYRVLPELILENKGGSSGAGGVGPQLAALYRFGLGTKVNKQSAQLLKEMGMISRSSILKTTTSGTSVGPVLGIDVLSKNPIEWVSKTLIPHLAAKFKIAQDDGDKLIQASNMVFRGNQLAANIAAEMIKKRVQYTRFGTLYKQTDSMDQAYQRGLANDPDTNYKALHASWENLKISLGQNVIPIIIPLTNRLATGLNAMGRFFQAHPGAAKATIGIAALGSGLLIAGGAAHFAKGAFGALGIAAQLTTGPVGKATGALTGLLSKVGAPGLLTNVISLGGKFLGLGLGIGVVVYAIQHWDDIMKWCTDHIGLLKVGLAALVGVADLGDKAIGILIGKLGDLFNLLGAGAIWLGKLAGVDVVSAMKGAEQVADNYLKRKGINFGNGATPLPGAGGFQRGSLLNKTAGNSGGADFPMLSLVRGNHSPTAAHDTHKANVVPISQRRANESNHTVHVTQHNNITVNALQNASALEIARHVDRHLGDQTRSALKHTTAGQGANASRHSQGRDPLS